MRYILLIFALLIAISVLAFSVAAQVEGPATEPLKITVMLKNTACVGEPFTLMATLTNMGDKEYVIDPVGIWMSFVLTANERYTGSISISGKTVPIADSMIDGGWPPPASAGRLRRRLVTLSPRESYTGEKLFDPSRDHFFITPGKYTIDLTYAPMLADPNGYGGLSGSAKADSRAFTIQRCD